MICCWFAPDGDRSRELDLDCRSWLYSTIMIRVLHVVDASVRVFPDVKISDEAQMWIESLMQALGSSLMLWSAIHLERSKVEIMSRAFFCTDPGRILLEEVWMCLILLYVWLRSGKSDRSSFRIVMIQVDHSSETEFTGDNLPGIITVIMQQFCSEWLARILKKVR